MPTSNRPAFEGDRESARSFLRRLAGDMYYTYVLLDTEKKPFYVGKGKRQRALDHENEALRLSPLPTSNPFKCREIRKIVSAGGRVHYQIDRIFDSQAQRECLEREQALITHFARRCDGGILTNLAAGIGSVHAPDPFSTARHAATLSGVSEYRPERTVLNLFLQTLGGVDSVPIKPLSEYRNRLVGAYPSPKNLRNVSRRNALTIVAIAVAAGQRLQGRTRLPRSFVLLPDLENWPLSIRAPEEVRAVVENGAASDILKLGICRLIPAEKPEDEVFELVDSMIPVIASVLGEAVLERLDL